MAKSTQHQGVRTDPKVRMRIRELRRQGYNASQIHRELEDSGFGDRVPGLRTVQNIVRQMTPENSEEWSVATTDMEADDVAAILRFLGFAMSVVEGGKIALTESLARWIARLARLGIRWEHPGALLDLADFCATAEGHEHLHVTLTEFLAWVIDRDAPKNYPTETELRAAAERYGWPLPLLEEYVWTERKATDGGLD